MSDYTTYNPVADRFVINPFSTCEAFLHLMKCSIGTGVLALPGGFADCGYLVGFIATVIIVLLNAYCARLLVAVQFEYCQRKAIPTLTYHEIASSAFRDGPNILRHKPFSVIVHIFFVGSQIGVACNYMIFVDLQMGQVIQFHFMYTFIMKFYFVFFLIFFLMLAFVNDLKHFGYLNFAADVSTIISFLIMFKYFFHDILQLKVRHAVGTMSRVPILLGILVFAAGLEGVVIPIENSMLKPEKFGSIAGAMNMTIIPIILLYSAVGFFGYYRYGDNTQGLITLNFPTEETLAQVCKIGLSFAMFVKYELSLYVSYDIIWKSYVAPLILFTDKPRIEFICQIFLRLILIFITVFMTFIFPSLELLAAFVGSLFMVVSCIILPPLFNCFCYWSSSKNRLLRILCTLIIMSIGICICVTGVYTSIKMSLVYRIFSTYYFVMEE